MNGLLGFGLVRCFSGRVGSRRLRAMIVPALEASLVMSSAPLIMMEAATLIDFA